MESRSGEASSRDRILMFADALLFCTGAFVVASGIALALQGLATALALPVFVQDVIGSVATLVNPVLGALAAWVLHDRRLGWPVLVGFVAGWLVAGALGALFALVISATVEFGGDTFPTWVIALAVLLGSAYLSLIGVAIADAVRDLRAGATTHRRLDVLRLASVGLLLVLIAVATYEIVRNPMSEGGEAIIFAIAFAFVAGLMVAGADLADRLWGRRREQPATAEKLS